MPIYDLTAALRDCTGNEITTRLAQAADMLPEVGLVALNGIPIIGQPPTYFGAPVDRYVIEKQIRKGMGFGGVLTFMNKTHSLEDLADKSYENDHDWAMRHITVTLCFAGCPTFVEMSFGRDRRFHLSWVEPRGKVDWSLPRVFTATGSLKDWQKYTANRNSSDFLNTQRTWLNKAHAEIHTICPEYI